MTRSAEEIDLTRFDVPPDKPRRPRERVPGQLVFYLVAALLAVVSFGQHLLRVFAL